MTAKGFFKFGWFCKTDKQLHLAVGAMVGLLFGICAAFAAAASAEYKDWMWNGRKGGFFGWIHGNGFDWLDFLATMVGGVAGSVCHHYAIELLGIL